jgi:hypothetical protein
MRRSARPFCHRECGQTPCQGRHCRNTAAVGNDLTLYLKERHQSPGRQATQLSYWSCGYRSQLRASVMQDHRAIEQLERDGVYHRTEPPKRRRQCRTMNLPTVDSANSIPSINNSPLIRGTLRSGLSRVTGWSAANPDTVRGRPPNGRTSSANGRKKTVAAPPNYGIWLK